MHIRSLAAARLPDAARAGLKREVQALGPIHVNEMQPVDLVALPAFISLREMEKRRLLATVGA